MQFPAHLLRRCWFLAGPTACGKTAAGVVLAERLGAEIVALDSMSLYRGMDIGTAKPSVEERRRVRHHLVDVLEPHQDFSVAEYLAAAQEACLDITRRGRTPLFVGGTGLYLRGVLRGVFRGPSANWELRRRLEADARELGADELHRRLIAVDPRAARSLHPHDTRRVIRALEVYELTGRPLSEQQEHGPRPVAQRPEHVYWLYPPRKWLYSRIDRRVERMVAEGLVEETRRLLAALQAPGRTARQALGYREIIDWLEGRIESLAAAVELIQRRTRQFAKRQHTWFRNLIECRPIEMTGDESPAELAARVMQV
ncbi:MAG: tRNA (adenosine(37)-N6)-dimethylallyltransferase MiaA [Planctomycetes bacterium]|nr:tRNA (adenosine(37)-N6)-dimethylallyltransferase MiaA [Planctomycetota bacterium]